MVQSVFKTVKIFRASASCSQIVNGEKIFNTVYIQLEAVADPDQAFGGAVK